MKNRLRLLCAALTAAMLFSLGASPVLAARTDLRIAMDADIDTLHATDYSTTIELNILNQIYDTMMYMNPDGTEEPEPRIATDYAISEDGLTYTFTIRDDATFHDGTPVTAQDVAFSLELFKSSDYQGSQIEMMDSVEVVDGNKVACHLSSPYAPFLLAVCVPHIVSKAYYEADPEGFVREPVGSGPYKFVSRSIGSNVKLTAYEDYYRGAPAIKDLTFEVIPDPATMAIALQTQEIHFAEVSASVLAQLQMNPAITLAEAPNSGFAYVSMNMEKAPFDNRLVRQAINYAINRENFVNVCYEGKAEVNSNICSKERFGYSDDQFQYTYDPEKAKELLAEAGIETPYNLGQILVRDSNAGMATVIQNDLKAVGLECEIAVEEFNAYISDLVSGNYTLTCLEMTLEGDTQELQMAFVTDFIGMANNARYSDPEMDELFEQARVETDTEKRAAIFDTIFNKAQDEAIYAVLCNPLMLYAYNGQLSVPEFKLEGYYYVYDFAWQE